MVNIRSDQHGHMTERWEQAPRMCKSCTDELQVEDLMSDCSQRCHKFQDRACQESELRTCTHPGGIMLTSTKLKVAIKLFNPNSYIGLYDCLSGLNLPTI